MATTKTKGQQSIGSAQWVLSERQQADQFIGQEVEEFSFSARNELEWLNEHMAEIFSRDQRNFTDVFKTPGKLRGKTPRTARKKDHDRAPLTDLFAPNPQATMSPAERTPFYNKVARFQVAEDNASQQRPQSMSRKSPLRVGKENTDSGYHGMTEDEMDVDSQARELTTVEEPVSVQGGSVKNSTSGRDSAAALLQVQGRSTEDSFVSAREGSVSNNPSIENLKDEVDDNATVPDDDDMEREMKSTTQNNDEFSIHEDQNDLTGPAAEAEHESLSASDASSPEKPLLRKSSLNFASLPPRETLTGKRSIGVRNSHAAVQATTSKASNEDEAAIEQDDEGEFDINTAPLDDNAAAQHSKISTQRLHDRINMLGNSKEAQEPRSTAHGYPKLPLALSETDKDSFDDSEDEDRDAEDDDWIAPIPDRPSTSIVDEDSTTQPVQDMSKAQARPTLDQQKSISMTELNCPIKDSMAPDKRQQKATPVSNPDLSNAANELQTTTPAGSPAKRLPDGPLSASKSRLYSVLKSAKNIFASSAGASAQAKIEATASPAPKQKALQMPGGFDVDVAMAPKTAGRPISVISSISSKTERKTRSSAESDKKRDKEAKQQQRAADELEKAREKERKKAAEQKQEREDEVRQGQERADAITRANSQRKATEDQPRDEESLPATTPKGMLPPGKLRAPTRLGKPARQPAAQAAKPVPVNIRVASQSQRMGSVQPPASSVEPTPPPGAPRQQAATRAAAANKVNPGQNARLKALEAAARKKEQEEKVAERKAEQKREFERKRAAKAEEERKAEQEKKAAEQQKVLEAKLAAQKLAEQRKLEQQRREAAAEKAKADAELAAATEREKAQAAPLPRGDVQGTLRQLGKSTVTQEPLFSQAKPGKRQLQQDTDEQMTRPGLQRGPPSYQQQDAKRRKTNDDDDFEAHGRHSVMAPPKRPSNMRKEAQPKFPHGYAHAPPPAAHHSQNMFRATLNAQHQLHNSVNGKAPMQLNDTVKLSNARIPFAENANPPAIHFHASTSSAIAPAPSNAFKTPARPAHIQPSTLKTKSSPAYANGENIALPEINTDSEDSDSENEENATGGFRAPSWVASPALRDLLTQQQLVDPESIFGPIEPLQMDEVFRNGKNAERMKKFRDRGESALWTESGDAVTSAEKRRDREARARVVRDGGWSFSRDV